MLVPDDVIADLRGQLLRNGSVNFADPDGKEVFIILGRLLKIDRRGLRKLDNKSIVLAYCGYGAGRFRLDRPLNGFRLITVGFPTHVAGDLADLVNRIMGLTGVAVNPVAITAPKSAMKALPAPSKTP